MHWVSHRFGIVVDVVVVDVAASGSGRLPWALWVRHVGTSIRFTSRRKTRPGWISRSFLVRVRLMCRETALWTASLRVRRLVVVSRMIVVSCIAESLVRIIHPVSIKSHSLFRISFPRTSPSRHSGCSSLWGGVQGSGMP